jgi:hypothetical protein
MNGGVVVPLFVGDWKCCTEGCGYHNFAKNVNYLRYGTSHATTTVVQSARSYSPWGPAAVMGTTWLECYSFPRIFKGLRERTGPDKIVGGVGSSF